MNSDQWQRLEPLACLFYFFRTVKQIISQGMQAIAPLAVVLFTSKDKVLMLGIVGSVGLIAITISAICQYWFFRFRVLNDEIQLKYGIFKRQHRIIQFERIQNIDIKLPIYFKPFKLVILGLDTAGSNSDEASLAGISTINAEQFRDKILEHQHTSQQPTQELEQTSEQIDEQTGEQTNQISTKQTIATASIKDLSYYGLFGNQAIIFFALLAPFANKLQEQQQWFNFLPFINQLSQDIGKGPATAVVIFASFITIYTAIKLLSIASSIILHYNFRLTKQDKKLVCEGGLINQYQKALELRKVQQISRIAPLFARLVKRENIACYQIGNAKHNDNLIIPAQPISLSQQLQQTLFTNSPIETPKLLMSHYFIINKFLIWSVLPSLVLLLFILINGAQQLLWLCLAPFLLTGIFYRYWKTFCFDMDQQYISIKSGILGYKQTTIPIYKIQRVEITQTLLQKRRHLAGIKLYLATGSYTISFISLSLAQQWFDIVNAHIQTDQRPWY